jgi:hypothetical protein
VGGAAGFPPKARVKGGGAGSAAGLPRGWGYEIQERKTGEIVRNRTVGTGAIRRYSDSYGGIPFSVTSVDAGYEKKG